MTDWQSEFERRRSIAALAVSAGDFENAIAALRRAVDLHRVTGDEPPTVEQSMASGEASSRLGELLWDERLPEAVQAYQDAADAFGRSEDPDRSAACARRVVEGVRLLRFRPAERLDLLIARYDTELRSLALLDETLERRAELEFKVATVLQRRDRVANAAARYARSLEAFCQLEGCELRQAACHHRLADLYNRELQDEAAALLHYEAARELYAEHEAPSEGEQMNRVLCEWQIEDIANRKPRSV
jgi:hypothetical protein